MNSESYMAIIPKGTKMQEGLENRICVESDLLPQDRGRDSESKG